MADDNIEDPSPPPSSSHPYFVRGGFPFVFLPTTLTTGFTFSNNQTHVSPSDNQSTIESRKKKENDENSEEIEEEERAGTIDDDETDRNDENDDQTDEKNDLRISQPKYSQLLKDLDFSQARMVDVTNLLSHELDQQENDLTSEENESPKKPLGDDKYQSLSSISSDEEPDHQTPNNNAKKDNNLRNAANEIQNDLNSLAAIIQGASKISADKNEDEDSEHLNHGVQKKPTFDEDDDTSKQATQNYDLHDNEQEDIIPSSKSSKIPRLINQYSNGSEKETKSSMSNIDTNKTTQNPTAKEEEEEEQPSISWENLINGTNPIVQPPSELIHSHPIIDSHSTPKKTQQQQTFASSAEKSNPRTNPSTQQKSPYRSYQITSSSSSSDTDSVVEHALPPSKAEHPSSPPKQPTPPRIPSQTLRQDSQATLIDENLDDLSSQLKHGLLDQERQTLNTSTREERTIDGLGSMSFPLSTPDILSTDLLENDILNRPTNDLLRRLSNQRNHYNQHSFDNPQRSSLQRKRNHRHQRHSASRAEGTNSRKTDDDWLTMLEKLEREHKSRLERQQQQYEDYMHSLEEKMKRRFDDYLTLTNGFQESRLDNYNETIHVNRTHTSIPIDSNIGRYKEHSHTHPYRPLAKDLISHYYPEDSTLNILTTENKRTNISNYLPRSQSKEDIVDLRTELSAKHAKHIADLRLYYEYEINELKSQLNRSRMGSHTSSSTRQSMDTIERINKENIRLHDEVKELRHSLRMTGDENVLLKRQVEELREQLNTKDIDLKTYHRTIADLEQQLTETENTKERQDEKSRHADRQVFFYREENEKIKIDLNLTRERLLRLEERYREQENENDTLKRQVFTLENDGNRMKNPITDDHKLHSAMALNTPASREYGRFTLTNTTKNLSSPINTPRDGNITSRRYQSNNTENLFRHTLSPRPVTRISDYLNERPVFPQPYVSPTRHVYSPRKTSPSRRRVEPMSRRSSLDRQTRQSEQLEQKFDQLLKKKRDLETRLNRIPLRGLTNTDRQLYDVLEREIERVEQQITSVKLELRKLNLFRPH